MKEIFNVKDKLPNVECGSYLVYANKSFPKNSRCYCRQKIQR